MTTYAMKIIGTTASVNFIHEAIEVPVAARVDSGARTSSVWASDIVADDSVTSFKLFDKGHADYTGEVITLPTCGMKEVRSSMGSVEYRHVVEIEVEVEGEKTVAEFTLADRSKQRYPILLGRNLLAGKFLIDCSQPGAALHDSDVEEFEIEGVET